MSALSNYAENKIAKALFGNTDLIMLGAGINVGQMDGVYIGLFSAVNSGESALVTEIIGDGYYRRKVLPTNWDTTFVGEAKNKRDISFGTARGAWPTITHVGVFDSLQGGNLWMYAPLALSRPVGNGDPVLFAVGTLVFGVNANDPLTSSGSSNGGTGGINSIPPISQMLEAVLIGYGSVEADLYIGLPFQNT